MIHGERVDETWCRRYMIHRKDPFGNEDMTEATSIYMTKNRKFVFLGEAMLFKWIMDLILSLESLNMVRLIVNVCCLCCLFNVFSNC